MDLKARSEAPGTRRRGQELEDAILEAAWDTLIENGYSAFTFEAVATRAGTSRAVLYRRWPRRDDLLVATLKRHWWSRPIELPDTGSLRDDIVGLLRNANSSRVQLMTMINVQLMDYFRESGSSFRELRDAMKAPDHPTSLDMIVARAVERGELSDTPRSPRVVSLPFDLFRHELFMSARAVPDDTIREIVDEIWLPLLHTND